MDIWYAKDHNSFLREFFILHLRNPIFSGCNTTHSANTSLMLRSGVAKQPSSARGAKISFPARQYLGPKLTLIMLHASAFFSYWNGIVLTDFNTLYNMK